ncbi:MAG: hypothetical protein WC592_01205 [Candidatus Omnitrophota bacterium]|nr:hypothetical protein [Candidatus Omnitrophota bacterium]
MEKSIKRLIIFLLVYLVLFWIGFRSGEIYNRMKNKVAIERVIIPQSPRYYYIVENSTGNWGSTVTFSRVGEDDTILQFFFNEKLRPLLKLRDLKIYKNDGERIY